VRLLRRSLRWKLLASYLLTVAVGAVVLWTAAQMLAPAAFSEHEAAMARLVGPNPQIMAGLIASFTGAMNAALATSAVAAVLIAAAVSVFVARRIAEPIATMRSASARIADGQYSERVPVHSDDEIGQLAIQFNRMAEALEHTERRRQQLIGDVAHELRTPLAGIAGYAEAMVDGVIPAENDNLQRIYREAMRLGRLVDDLQGLSRADAGQITLQKHPVEPWQLVDAAVVRLRPQFREKTVALIVDVPHDLPMIHADPDRIGQVLSNVLGNALQYTAPRGRVEVRARRSDESVEVTIRDSGIGIAPADLSRVFDRFYRVDRSRARANGGSGVGLTIARYLVEAHGGRIYANSLGLGRGTTFVITLPILA